MSNKKQVAGTRTTLEPAKENKREEKATAKSNSNQLRIPDISQPLIEEAIQNLENIDSLLSKLDTEQIALLCVQILTEGRKYEPTKLNALKEILKSNQKSNLYYDKVFKKKTRGNTLRRDYH